jgi:hypothetical protein
MGVVLCKRRFLGAVKPDAVNSATNFSGVGLPELTEVDWFAPNYLRFQAEASELEAE